LNELQNIDLPDARDRALAVGTFDRSVVVTAGAGTGKTTLLIDRLVHLILRNPDPLEITQIVALTFTNKAADEMRLRLRERLQEFLAVGLDREPDNGAGASTHAAVRRLIDLYQLSKEEMDRRIQEALRNLERSDIGTIHSFAATVLRLYPLEAGVDPQFREDDGAEFERLFDEQWDNWLGQELALTSARSADWRVVLGRFQLNQIKALAHSFASEVVDLRQDVSAAMPAPVRDWLTKLEANAAALSARHPEERVNEKIVRAACAILGNFKRMGSRAEDLAGEYSLVCGSSINSNLRGWTSDEIKSAQEIVRAVRGLSRVNDDIAGLLRRLLLPFAAAFRERLVSDGHLSFDGLLVRARNLVRDNRAVRAELKRRYRSILIDEFQDTDPIQYEILLYLAEADEQSASDWRKVSLEPGKIFIVGDPKQSIYAFRRADIEAYLAVVERIIKAQNGVECRLTTNFRSNSEILDVVNGAFERIIRAQEGAQPEYIAIRAAPGRASAPSNLPKVTVRKIIAAQDKLDAETARQLEGQSLARWLREEVLDKTAILNARGETTFAQPRDVAILLRKLTDIHDYLEPLRRHGIRYIVEGERHFYAAGEIIDAINLLRAVENPFDRLALVGVLRSPLGGLDDQQIYELEQNHLLDYRAGAKLKDTRFPASVTMLYDALDSLHDEIARLPIGAALGRLFEIFPLELLAACHFHGEQAVANLQKLVRQAELLGREGITTLKAAIRLLEKRMLEVKDEGESVLAEENLDAVRVMSIHKAKGLEFPIVILAGCHSGIEGQGNIDGESLFDWSTGLNGLHIGQTWDLPGVYIGEKARLRNSEEQKRLLYVAMTRARENLVISYADTGRRGGGFLDLLDEAAGGAISAAASSRRAVIGNGAIAIDVVQETLTAPEGPARRAKAARGRLDWQPFVDVLARRGKEYDNAAQRTPFLPPTRLKAKQKNLAEAAAGARRRGTERDWALALGDLAHGFLQHWEYASDSQLLRRELDDYIDSKLPEELRARREQIAAELQTILGRFFHSKIYDELAAANILGREVPLIMSWDGRIMEGVIDLIYEKDGLLYLADYKTDRITRSELEQSAESYRQQAEIYSEAARRSLRREPTGFKLIFLGRGEAVEIAPRTNEQMRLF
jgi:ATP-dependent helicase/nuclease subunit A